MASAVPLERDALASALLAAVTDEQWQTRLRSILSDKDCPALHVAVMREPFLTLLLDGTKTVESRFSVNRVCPFDEAHRGDILALKAQSGPVLGLALIEHAAFYELDPHTISKLRARFDKRLCADADFWAQRANARYGSLLKVTDVEHVQPMRLDKRDRRGWVRLKPPSPQLAFAP